jgi:hypothetical protein
VNSDERNKTKINTEEQPKIVEIPMKNPGAVEVPGSSGATGRSRTANLRTAQFDLILLEISTIYRMMVSFKTRLRQFDR